MKIAFVRHSILNRGGDRITLEYAAYLAGKGHEVTVWANLVKTPFSIPPLVRVNRPIYKSKLRTILKAISTRFPQDLIIADIIPMASFLSLRNSGRVVYFAQDYNESYYNNPFMKIIIRALFFYALGLRKIPVIAVSANLADSFRLSFASKAIVVNPGIDFNEFYPDKDAALLAGKGNKKAVLIFAVSERRKGLDIAIDVLKNIAGSAIKDTVVVWAVGGENINIPGLECKNFGFVGPGSLRKIFSSADAFLFTSRSEGLPAMALYALACGCPLVTTAAVAMVNDNIDALVAAAEDTAGLTQRLNLLLENGDLRERLKSQGYETVKRYDINESKERFEEALLRLGAGDA